MIQDGHGNKYWYKEGYIHREDGPAIEYVDGEKLWYKEGKRHREDGPAIERVDGRKEYWKNGRMWTDEELNEIGLCYYKCKNCDLNFVVKINNKE